MSIDMNGSTWQNPEGFAGYKRPEAAPKPVDEGICGDRHPDGWACEATAGRPHAEHWADTGAGVLRWAREQIDVTAYPGATHEFIDGAVMTMSVAPGVLGEVHSLAAAALQSQSPADWAIALGHIRDLAR